MAAVSLKRSIETDPHTVPGPLGLLSDRACGSEKTWKSNRLQMSLQCWSRFSVPALLQNTLDKKVSSFVAPFFSHYVFCGIACEQQSYFRLSLLSLRKMTPDLIGQHQNKRFYVTEIVLPLGFADVNFSEGEKRRPEIRLLFAGYYGTDKDYFGGVDRYLGQSLGRHPGRRSLYRSSVGRHSL